MRRKENKMAEALSVEFSSTQEGQTSQMNHPSVRIREFLKKQQHRNGPPSSDSHGADTESGNSGDEQQRAQDNQSPPPNCSICLGRVKSKCFTDSCMHQFCFSCLLEWSKVKPECPLCKQAFKSIIHNVTSMDSYDEYKVEEQQRHVNWINITNTLQPLDFILSAGLPTYRLAINRVQRPDLHQNRFFQLFLNETPLTDRFARTYPNDTVPQRYSGTSWRAYCYQRRLHAIPISGNTFGPHGPHVRTITAQFYRENPAQLHRLIPWLNRELVSLFPTSQGIQYLLQHIENLIQTYDMTSREFRRRIRVYVPNHTDHFVHELINFARSPFDIIGYDRNVAYNPVFEDDHVIMLSSSSSDESDIEFVVDMRSTNNDNDITTATTSSQSTAIENNNASTSASVHTANSFAESNNTFVEMIRRNLRMIPGNDGPLVTPPSVRALEGDDSDHTETETDTGDEEITNYLHTKPTVTNEEVIRGRTDAAAAATNANAAANASAAPANASASPTIVHDNSNPGSSSRPSERTVIVSLSNNVTERVPSPAAVAVVVTHTGAIAANTTNQMMAIAANVSDSDSDDCQFVCAKKPPHLRTPEYVELNSESDSDVVFVDEMLLLGQTIKTENNSKNKVSNIITTSSAGPSTVSSSNIIVSNGRRKRRHHNGDNDNVPPINQIEQSPENYTSTTCTTICKTPLALATVKNTIEVKPSTSSQWVASLNSQTSSVDMYQSANRPNAIVFNRNNNARVIGYMARKTTGGTGGKRIYEANSTSDDEKSTDAEQPSPSSTSNSSSDSENIQSSSGEEYVVSASTRKRKPSTELSPRTTRKRYRKKVNVKQIAKRKKKYSKSTVKPKKRVHKKRSKRTKLPADTTSSSDNSSDERHSN